MKTQAIINVAVCGIAFLALVGFFWEFVIPGMALGPLLKGRWPKTVSCLAGLMVVILILYFPSESTPVSDAFLIVRWAMSSFLFWVGYQVPQLAVTGYRQGTGEIPEPIKPMPVVETLEFSRKDPAAQFDPKTMLSRSETEDFNRWLENTPEVLGRPQIDQIAIFRDVQNTEESGGAT